MKRGCLASSESALRNSWMQDVSASSLTTVPFHTEANSSSLRTGRPACVTSALSTAEALGVSLISRLPDSRLPVSRSNRYRPKLTICSTRLFRSLSHRHNPGEFPAASRDFRSMRIILFDGRGEHRNGNLDARSELLPITPHGHEGGARDTRLRGSLRSGAQSAGRDRRGGCRSEVRILRADRWF